MLSRPSAPFSGSIELSQCLAIFHLTIRAHSHNRSPVAFSHGFEKLNCAKFSICQHDDSESFCYVFGTLASNLQAN